jgi:hypothetical protein
MRLLRSMPDWGLCPQTPRICRFFPARMDASDFSQGTGITCPPPFRPLNRSLRLLPSRALSRPAQVCPGWTMSTPPCNTSSANGDNPLNFVSHSRGSLQTAPVHTTGRSDQSLAREPVHEPFITVPLRPGNAGGGKGPHFRCAFEEGEER